MKKTTVGYPYQGVFRQDAKIPGFLTWAGPISGMWLAGGFDPVVFATKHLVTLNNNTTKVIGTHALKFGGYWGWIINKQPGNTPSAELPGVSWSKRDASVPLSGIVPWQSGIYLPQAPNSVNLNFNMRAPIAGSDRTIGGPDITGTNAITAMPIIVCDPAKALQPNQYVNPSCFAPPVPGAPGRPGVNGSLIMPYIAGPAFFNTDLSIFKRFRITESKKLQFRASAYTFPNHPVPSFVSGDPNLRLEFDSAGRVLNRRFGFADSKVGKRIIQLGIEFEF